MLLLLFYQLVRVDCARGGGGGRGKGRGGRRERYGSRIPTLIDTKHRNPASASYYEHKDVKSSFVHIFSSF